MPDALDDLRAAFPVRERWLYLNHAAIAPLPAPAAAALAAFAEEAARDGATGWLRWLAEREEARGRAARLIGGDPAGLAFTTSTSQGLLTVAEGLPLAPGDEIVVLQDDFPANQIPWFRQQRRGVEVVVAPRDVDAILARVGPRTRLVAVSWVLYDTGQRLDVARLGRALKQDGQGPLLCVDAIQGLGAFPLDVEAAGIDFLSADSHKWLLGLEGIGLFWCRPSLVSLLDPPMISWLSVKEPFAPYAPGKPLLDDARRFEYACLPTAELFAFDASLQLILGTGVERMSAHLLELTAHLGDGLRQRGWRLRSPWAESSERSGIVSAEHPLLSADAVVAGLLGRQVCASARRGAVRFSPHAWNSHTEIERLLALLP